MAAALIDRLTAAFFAPTALLMLDGRLATRESGRSIKCDKAGPHHGTPTDSSRYRASLFDESIKVLARSLISSV